MANIGNTLKAGYFPFEPHHVVQLKKILQFFGKPVRVLDATAGDGAAIIQLMEGENAEIYANELEEVKAQTLIGKLGINNAIQGDMYNLDIAPKSMNMIFANPPFNQAGGKRGDRTEVHMVDHQWRWLADGGVMVIVTYTHHVTAAFAKQICNNAVNVEAYTFPDKHLDTYDYSVILATKDKEASAHDPNGRAQKLYNQVARKEIPALSECVGYPVISTIDPSRDFWFTTNSLNVAQMTDALQKMGPHTTRRFQLQNHKTLHTDVMQPTINMTFHRLVDAVAGGAMNQMEFFIKGMRCVIGSVQELVDIEIEKTEDEESIHTEWLQSWVATTFAYFEDGTYLRLDNEQLGEFIQENQEAFNETLADRLKPRYDITTSIADDPFKQEIFPHLKRQRVKGQHKMYPAQLHIAASGVKQLLEKEKWLLLGDPGVGKTAMALAVADTLYRLGKIPAGQINVVITPQHVVPKFAREIRQQLPHAETCELALKENEYGKLKKTDPIAKLNRFMERVDRNPDKLYFLVIARNDAKYGEGASSGVMRKPHHVKREDGLTETFYTFHNPTTGAPLMTEIDSELVPITPEAVLAQRHFNIEYKLIGFEGTGTERKPVYDMNKPLDNKLTALWGEQRQFGLPTQGNGRVVDIGGGDYIPVNNEPITDLWLHKQGNRFDSPPRMPFWKYIQRKYSDRICMLIADEVHEDNNPSSDIAQTFLHIAPLAKYLVGLTATLTNGYAESMRLIMTTFYPPLMSEYPYGEVGSIEWTRDMGTLRKVLDEQKNVTAGANSNVKRRAPRVSAAPGVSTRLSLLISQFATPIEIDDMSKYMVDMKEVHVPCQLSGTQADLVNDAMEVTTAYIMDRRESYKDNSYGGPYYQFNLKYPDNTFRHMETDHTINERDEYGTIMSTEVVNVWKSDNISEELTGKELKAIEIVKEALPLDHGVGFYMQSTGGDNAISYRLKDAIENAVPEAKVCVLESSVPGQMREAWIDAKVSLGFNVLICNPSLVETGLDLLYFNNLYFVEIEFKLKTLEQAGGRAYRLPQKRACTVGYMYYEGTMQADAIQLMMEKKQASMVVRGKASSAKSISLSGSLNSALDKLQREGGFNAGKLSEIMDSLNIRKDESAKWDIEGYEFEVSFETYKKESAFKLVKREDLKVSKVAIGKDMKKTSNGQEVAQLAMF